MLRNPSPQILSSICCGLSLLKMSKELSSKLFFISSTLSVFSNSSSSLELLTSSIKQYSTLSDINTIIDFIPKDLLNYLETCTALPFTTQPIFSSLMLISSYCDSSIMKYLNKLILCKSNELLIKCFSIINDNSLISTYSKMDYKENLANLEASLLLILRADGDNINLKEFTIKLFENQPKGLGSFPSTSNKFGSLVYNKVDDPRFTGLLLRHSQITSNIYQVTPILLQHFVDMNNIKLSNEQKDYLIFTLN